jgi:4-amino-4-deoxy-L-arabinose transferase-like glycosyltransferase
MDHLCSNGQMRWAWPLCVLSSFWRASYRIELPGLYMDEVDFVNAAQASAHNTMIHLRLGSPPLFIMPYLGALKAWIYAPVFRLFGVSALTVRLPAILIAAARLLIWYWAMRETLGPLWSAIVTWIMAVDPANVFPTLLNRGPTVLMHFFQAGVFALWFSYRLKPKLWKLAGILLCFGLGSFDKFNFIWFAVALVVAVLLCYPDAIRHVWSSLPRFIPWITIATVLVALAAMLWLVWPLLYVPSVDLPLLGLRWIQLVMTLSGQAVAGFIFGSWAGIISISNLVIVVDGLLAMSNAEARENRQNGIFVLLIGFVIFLQIVITPRTGVPHHYSMIFPLPLLALGFFMKSLYMEIAAEALHF